MAQLGLTRRRFVAGVVFVAIAPQAALAQITTENAPREGTTPMRIRCRFGEQNFTVTLLENPSAREFAAMLPLELDIEDYSTNEKIAYLPRKLTEEGSGPFSNEAAGDLCYFAPWGNLAFFHSGYKYSNGLIRLGRLDDGPKPLFKRGKFSLHIERLPPR
jgi:hypothetical protein